MKMNNELQIGGTYWLINWGPDTEDHGIYDPEAIEELLKEKEKQKMSLKFKREGSENNIVLYLSNVRLGFCHLSEKVYYDEHSNNFRDPKNDIEFKKSSYKCSIMIPSVEQAVLGEINAIHHEIAIQLVKNPDTDEYDPSDLELVEGNLINGDTHKFNTPKGKQLNPNFADHWVLSCANKEQYRIVDGKPNSVFYAGCWVAIVVQFWGMRDRVNCKLMNILFKKDDTKFGFSDAIDSDKFFEEDIEEAMMQKAEDSETDQSQLSDPNDGQEIDSDLIPF